MKKIQNLSESKQRWLIGALITFGISDEDIELIMATKWWSICEDNAELKDAIKELWDIEFKSDKELCDYLFSSDNKNVMVLFDPNIPGFKYLVWSERTYKSSGAEIKTGDSFDSLEDFYNHLGESYRKHIDCKTFINFCFIVGNDGRVLVCDNGRRNYMEFIITDNKAVVISHIGELKDGFDRSLTDFIEAIANV